MLVAIATGATACEFGEHRGSHSNVYPEDSRSYEPPYQPEYYRGYQQPYQPEYYRSYRQPY